MAVNVTKFTSAGADIVYYGARDGTGYFQGATATAPAVGDQDGGPALKMEGAKTWPHTVTEPDTITVTGDDGVISQYQFEPVELPSFVVDHGVRDITLEALAQTTLVYAVGDASIGVIQPSVPTYQDMCAIVSSQAKSRASGSENSSMWDNLIIPNFQMVPLSRDSYAERAAGTHRYRITSNPASRFPWGEAMTEVNSGCTEAAAFIITTENRIHMHRFTGDAAEVQFNLDYTPAEESSDKCHVYVDGVVQVYTTDYTISASAKTLDFATGSIPASGAKVVIWYEYTG
jgi:hypothetical protein